MNDQTALARRSPAPIAQPTEELSFEQMLRMADTLFQSHILPNSIKNAQAAFAVIQKGRELGIPPMHALSNVFVVEGKPSCGAELMLALIYRDHGDDAVQFTETTAERCTIEYKRRSWRQARRFTFTIEEAKAASLTGKENWRKYPAAMLRARCVSAMARMAFPDTIGGMHLPEELGAEVDVAEDGEVRDVRLPESASGVIDHDPTMDLGWEPTDAGEVASDAPDTEPLPPMEEPELIDEIEDDEPPFQPRQMTPPSLYDGIVRLAELRSLEYEDMEATVKRACRIEGELGDAPDEILGRASAWVATEITKEERKQGR